MADLQRSYIERLEEYAKRLSENGDRESANNALLLSQLITSLLANAERDLMLAKMASHIDDLERRFSKDSALHSHAYQALLGEFRSLQRQQDDLRGQVAMHAAVIDIGIEKISAAIRKIETLNEHLTDSVEDLTKP